MEGNVVSTSAITPAVRLMTPPASPGYVKVLNNIVISLTEADQNNGGIEVATGYAAGDVSGNMSRRYVGTINTTAAATLTKTNNVKV